MYYVYLLLSKVKPKTYVGFTENLDRRLNEHNEGQSTFTAKYKPWSVIYYEKFETKGEAVKKEKFLKSKLGRRWISKNIFK